MSQEYPFVSIERERQDTPTVQAINRVLTPAASAGYLGRVRAVAVVALMNGGDEHIKAFAGTKAERRELIAALEELKMALLSEE